MVDYALTSAPRTFYPPNFKSAMHLLKSPQNLFKLEVESWLAQLLFMVFNPN